MVVAVPGGLPFSLLEFSVAPAPDMRARDIDGSTLLLCGDVDCQLFTITRSGTIDELPGGRVSAAAAPAGVLDWSAQALACVFGNGVHCFDGGDWLEVVQAVR